MKLSPSADVTAFLKEEILSHHIGGRSVPSANAATHEVLDPCNGKVLATTSLGGSAEISKAIVAAEDAFPAWSALLPVERAVHLHRLADLLEKHAETLAQVEALDVGKAITAARSFDIPFGVECIRYFADFATRTQVDRPLAIKNMEARVHRTPYGACGFIFPWNFPFDLLMWGVIPAIAAGNTAVVKPSEITPLSTLMVARLATEAGIPDGVLNVVVGAGEAGAALSSSPRIKRMSFTGSPETGKKVATVCAANLVPCKLELGGKGAAVLFDDVDVASAATQLAGSITFNTGQVCCTATRWIVHEKIHDSFVDAVTQVLRNTKIGSSLDESTEMGPVVSPAQMARVLSYFEKGRDGGARTVLAGDRIEVPDSEGGFYVSPCLLEGSPDNVCFREEIFGPSAYIVPFKQENEAIALVNSIDYGLANSVWSADLDRAQRVAEAMVAGNSWINAHNVFAYGLPYGGVNLSGMGGGVNSPETYYDYLRSQTIARPL
jgi:acyl-CoA reductase-like NAD-dependent aldehyde dehydrogenase